ncbi:MAG TPA: hypothetical protein VHF47_07430 [Acidimicrobiales bacterium]|nr:hypothetical protein [Acidimicrobiales bacterium]
MIDWRERLADVLAVAVALLAGASLAVGIRIALFAATPLRAGSFSSADVVDVLTPPVAEDAEPTTTTAVLEEPAETSTTTTSTSMATTTTTTAATTRTTSTSSTTASSTSTTTTTVDDSGSNRGRSSENRGRGRPDEPDD